MMYGMIIPVGMREAFELEAWNQQLDVRFCPETAHDLMLGRATVLKYEFFTEREFEHGKRVRDTVKHRETHP